MPEHLALADARFGDEAAAAVAEVLRSGRLTQGPKVLEFEEALAAYCGTAHGVAVTSATTALALTLAALDIGPGDRVVVPDFTYPATGNVVLRAGAEAVLVDVDPRTYNLDPGALEAAIDEETSAVIAVDLFGLPADYDRIEALVAERGIPLICDAACSLGASHRGRRCGSIGVAACFSFHPRKPLTTGEGGMVLTADDELAARMRRLRDHGGERHGFRYVFEEPGFNYRLTDMQAALGLTQVPGHDETVGRRRELARSLSAVLDRVGGVTPPGVPEGAEPCWQAYVAVLEEGIDRDAAILALRERGVEATIGTYALHAEPAYGGHEPGELPGSWMLARQAIALPLHQGLDEADMERVATELAAVL